MVGRERPDRSLWPANGLQAARSAGLRTLAYAGGMTPAHRLEDPGTVVFDDMRTLPGLLADQ